MKQSPLSIESDLALMSLLWSPAIKDDLEAFVDANFVWGQKGTPLEHIKGPRHWQRRVLRKITKHLKNNQGRIDLGLLPRLFRGAHVSGRGIGKTALMAMIIIWMLSTRIGCTIIVTANTENQLRGKTWPEIGRWLTLARNQHWFEKTAEMVKPAEWFANTIKKDLMIEPTYYYAKAETWAEENPDAFAGAHNHLGELVMMDEASGIPKPIWTVTEGFFTEPITNRFWLVFSNGRRNKGEFFECFHKNKEYWEREQIDSRTVEDVDVEYLQSIVDKHGEDSDEARIEVRGLFPKRGDSQFIDEAVVNAATQRTVYDNRSPLVMGVDPARKGPDKTVIRFRRGRDARSIPPYKLRGADNMQVVAKIVALIQQYRPDLINIDVGMGTGIIDRLRELGYNVREVSFGSRPDDERFADRRTEMYHKMRDFLYQGMIDDDPDLKADLIAPEIRTDRRTDKPRLQSKEEMRAEGMPSPDDSDALALTFDGNPVRKDLDEEGRRPTKVILPDLNYNPYRVFNQEQKHGRCDQYF